MLLGQDGVELRLGGGPQPGQRRGGSGPPHGDLADAGRSERSGHAPRVAPARPHPPRGHVGEPAAVPEPEQLVAAEPADDRAAAGVLQHRGDDVRVGRK